jgi:hypothetical protein
MAHFAKVNENNIVETVVVVPNDVEDRGQNYLVNELGMVGKWIQTSYNTVNNTHKLNGVPLRGNFASVGCVYDPVFDVFFPTKPFSSWKMDYDNFTWVAPVAQPEFEEGFSWRWSEPNNEWVKVAL